MPWQTVWRDPDLFIEYKGVKVYHAYKDGDYDQELEYWYAIYPEDNFIFYCPYEFDVRDLPKSFGMKEASHEEIIRYAIDHGYLTKDGVVEQPE